MKIIRPGHRYELDGFENRGSRQTLQFIEKKIVGDKLQTVQDGTTNEEVLAVLIDRIVFLNNIMSSVENTEALSHLYGALACLKSRTLKRTQAGVEGTANDIPVEELIKDLISAQINAHNKEAGDTNNPFGTEALKRLDEWNEHEFETPVLPPEGEFMTAGILSKVEEEEGDSKLEDPQDNRPDPHPTPFEDVKIHKGNDLDHPNTGGYVHDTRTNDLPLNS